jgi:hypothetical protein
MYGYMNLGLYVILSAFCVGKLPHSPLQLLVLSPCQTLAFYEGVQCPEETVIHL